MDILALPSGEGSKWLEAQFSHDENDSEANITEWKRERRLADVEIIKHYLDYLSANRPDSYLDLVSSTINPFVTDVTEKFVVQLPLHEKAKNVFFDFSDRYSLANNYDRSHLYALLRHKPHEPSHLGLGGYVAALVMFSIDHSCYEYKLGNFFLFIPTQTECDLYTIENL